MPTSRSAKERMKKAVADANAAGNSWYANEITANVMVGTTMIIIFVVLCLCLVLNEVGVFTVDKGVMRWSTLAAFIVEAPITVLNSIYVGTKKWLRNVLMIDLILVCSVLASTLGHNITLIMVFPLVISTRYFDVKYTRIVAIITAIIFAFSAISNGFVGVMNLNIIRFPEGIDISVRADQTLREAIIEMGYDKWGYVKSLILNEYLPRCIVFLSLSVSCSYVAGRGKDMIEMQSENVKKTSRIETELDLATKIQTSMLPCIMPAFPGHDNIALKAVYHPAKEVGGDFYDYFIIDKTHVGVVIADVSGKGVGAALFMTISKTVLKNQLQLGISPAQALTNANNQLCENNDAGLFVTCWAGVYDTESGVLTFVNAGHNPPVILKNGEIPKFISQRSGFVLAGMDGFNYREETIKLAPGDEMFFYTDGVTEATNISDELYGNDRLLDCLENCHNEGVSEQLDILKADIDAFVGEREQFDDITIMAMKIS
ncbi:MAG: PP2C family protein-serine/threonine phosphatase [Clostridiales bacterium]|nr:PP2C family protein-serine/threonine phosphatase [Candidatus Equinaster intestinalis]